MTATDSRIAERVAERMAERQRRKTEQADVRDELEERRRHGIEARKRAKLARLNTPDDTPPEAA